ncbi:multidrug resistance protein 7 [Spathaspora passalidarum NRRL Y-27907]|uniref:Multidrug resistance protein 7 n=1 Tax=Spathaspora passalidarum (strain NRRL Y-27907 / 11-Y1) TaxID=619300 RepID=G3ATB1_SPAPN|nr:multidrug resistance protein 7 [Spathaspora passalidarum NRRL Y-27907]EGW30874.1 multidrug resistance protein 7 [Spathaspora passalidarum NRRL Y-27907]
MVPTLIRDSFVGRLAYQLSGHKYFSYPEEHPDYIVPEKYLSEGKVSDFDKVEIDEGVPSNSSIDSEQAKPQDENIIVTWDGDDDPDNPNNWSFSKKAFVIFQVSFLTTSVYMASAVYTPGIEQIMEEFQIGEVVATLPLTLFVLGYAIGPLIFSPLSENAAFGRNAIYIYTLAIFVILQIPTALVHNIAGLCILRFITGVFASPCLATGAATVADIVPIPYIPVGLAAWSVGAVCGPSFGPFFGSILTVKGGWRWTFWFICIVAGFSLVFLSFTFPETYAKTLLYRRAIRLRGVTGNQRITSEGELENRNKTARQIAIETLWRPIEVFIMEPVILMINLYIALVYSTWYLFFEVYPIYFQGVRGFTIVELGCTYLATIIGVVITASIYIPTVRQVFTKRIFSGKGVQPEVFMPIAIVGAICMPVGLFIFGWSATTHTHWIGPLIGGAIFSAGGFLIFQTMFNFIAGSFIYVGSIFASNNLFRSLSAGCFPLFGRPLYNNLATKEFPVAWGSSLLAFITVAMIAIPVLFYLNGPKLRARSKYALHY